MPPDAPVAALCQEISRIEPDRGVKRASHRACAVSNGAAIFRAGSCQNVDEAACGGMQIGLVAVNGTDPPPPSQLPYWQYRNCVTLRNRLSNHPTRGVGKQVGGH